MVCRFSSDGNTRKSHSFFSFQYNQFRCINCVYGPELESLCQLYQEYVPRAEFCVSNSPWSSLGHELASLFHKIFFQERSPLQDTTLFSKAFVLKVQLFPLATFRIRKSNDLPLSAPRPLLSCHDQNYLQIPKFLLSAMPLKIYLEKLLNSCSFVLRCNIHIALLSSASSF